MIRICFVCLGNICRSPMAMFIMRDKVKRYGISDQFIIDSRATSYEEDGNDMHNGAKEMLRKMNISFDKHRATRVEKSDIDNYDYFICMDSSNIRNIGYIFDDLSKVSMLLDRDIKDPWYTGNFLDTYNDLDYGIDLLIERLVGGNYNCHVVAYPNVDWIDVTKGFVNSLGLVYNPLTTQIESHDVLCLLLSNVKIINNIIKDLNSDMWLYISRSYLTEKSKKNEVGSSVMPHKVNPINHENSMANIEISNSLIDALVNNLSISRMQRDLSDSSKLRNLGVIFAHCLISISETIIGLNKIDVNSDLLSDELNSHWEVLSEAIQTVLRKNGCMDAYEKLKELSRGKVVTKDDVINFINGLDIDIDDKNRLLNLTPMNYIGLCEEIVLNN